MAATPGVRRNPSPRQALLRLERMCAKAEHCTGELRRKLVSWQVSGEQADEIIESLIARKYVDDARFARAYVRDKYRFASWGRRKIFLGLRQKGVDEQLIEQAFDEIDRTEYVKRLAAVLKAKARQLPETDSFEARQKLLRLAVGRGYEYELAARVIAKLFDRS